jgi:hypothetical protein
MADVEAKDRTGAAQPARAERAISPARLASGAAGPRDVDRDRQVRGERRLGVVALERVARAGREPRAHRAQLAAPRVRDDPGGDGEELPLRPGRVGEVGAVLVRGPGGVADVVPPRPGGAAALGDRALAVEDQVAELADEHRRHAVGEAGGGVSDGPPGRGHPRQRLPLLHAVAVGPGPRARVGARLDDDVRAEGVEAAHVRRRHVRARNGAGVAVAEGRQGRGEAQPLGPGDPEGAQVAAGGGAVRRPGGEPDRLLDRRQRHLAVGREHVAQHAGTRATDVLRAPQEHLV